MPNPFCRRGSDTVLLMESWKRSRPPVSFHHVTATSSHGSQLLSARVSQRGRIVLRLRKSLRSITSLLQAHADMGHCPFFDTLDELKSYFGVDHVVLSKLALFTKQDGSAKHRLTWNFFGLMSIPRYGVPHRADSGPSV